MDKIKALVDEHVKDLNEELKQKYTAMCEKMDKTDVINPKFNKIRTNTMAYTSE